LVEPDTKDYASIGSSTTCANSSPRAFFRQKGIFTEDFSGAA
jgi:hypothetical protein